MSAATQSAAAQGPAATAPGAKTLAAPATRLQLVLGFGCVYVIWGSTYLAINWGVATIPPFMLGALRFIITGVLLYGWAVLRGAKAPGREEWKNAGIVGALLLLGGNGSIVWASQRVDSGVVSLLVATVPLWVVVSEGVLGKRPGVSQLIGVAIGLAGVGLLMLPSGDEVRRSAIDPMGALVLTLGSLSWTVGSLYSRSAKFARPASMANGMQMLAGGVLMLLASVAAGEFSRLSPAEVTTISVLSLAYLIVFGSIIAFSAYMWLLTVASPAAVGTYAYVNPVVAVLLGVVLGGERLPPQAFLAMTIIVGGVALVSIGPQLRAMARQRRNRERGNQSR